MNKIDLVYPCHAKDKETVEICVKYARKNIKNLRNIYVVSKTKLTDTAIWISEDIFPFTFQTLLNFGVSEVQATIGLRDYLVLSSKVLVLLGFLFQLPNIMLILGFMGVVTKQSLRKMRRYIYVAFAVLSACLTPPDILTMMGLWLPMILLFEFGIWAVAFIVHPYLSRQHS